jgi:hypothetical protein
VSGLVRRITAPERRWLWVLVVSGVLGFHVGMVGFPTWQVAVETAQVVAGLVRYPSGNPFYVYHAKAWTILHQICAVMLRAGVSEIVLSKALSGLLGMASFQALSMLVWALGGDLLIALGAPFLIFFTRAAEHGADYPIVLLGTDHTYGALGLSLFVLVLALFGAGCYRLGGFLLGIAPAVHVSVGIWLWMIVALAVAWDARRLRDDLRPAIGYFLAGCGIAAISLAVHLTLTYDVPKVDSAVTARYLAAFVSAWDLHRRPVRLWTVGVILNGFALAISILWLKALASDLRRPALFLLRAIAVSAGVSLTLMFVSWLPADRLPAVFVVLMPSRLLNFNTMLYVALLLGLLGVYRTALWSQFLTIVLAAGLLLSYRSMLWDGGPPPAGVQQYLRFNPLYVFELVSIGLVAAGGFRAWKTRTIRVAPIPFAATVARAVSLALVAAAAVLTWRTFEPVEFRDRTNDPFFAAVAAEPDGLLATGGSFHLVQLYTRRPVLLDGGALDALPYASEASPEMARILGEVYGIDFFNPPREARGAGAIPPRINKPVWERYSREQWLQIRHTFNVTQVLTRGDWRLDLPVEAQNEWLRLYRIPE